jgi:hypothetical protein
MVKCGRSVTKSAHYTAPRIRWWGWWKFIISFEIKESIVLSKCDESTGLVVIGK